MSLALVFSWSLSQTDVKIVSLNGLIEEEVYIDHCRAFEVHGQDTHVCRSKKTLYGLKQAPHAWYSRIDEYLLNLGFTNNAANPNLYYLFDQSDLLVLVLYADLILTSSSEKIIAWCKKKLASGFDMKEICHVHYFLGLEVWQSTSEVFG